MSFASGHDTSKEYCKLRSREARAGFNSPAINHQSKMRVSQLLSALLLPLTALAAKKPVDTFSRNNAKSYPVKLDDDKFAALTKAPRDFASVILLTALEPRYGCVACQDFHPEWQLLAQSWQKGDKAGESRTVFGTLDFADGKGTFQSVEHPETSALRRKY